jgi:hypothetical protein
MKKFISILAFSLFAVYAHAALPDVPQAPLCELSADPDTIQQSNLEETNVIDVRNVSAVSATNLSYINQHLQWEEYTTADLDLAGIQAFFAKEEPYNELYVITYKVKSSGAIFTQVLSYPGDNAYSLFFDVNGKIIANSQDGDVSLKIGDQSIECWSAAQ